MRYYVAAFRRYVDFLGRASRPEYWVFVLIHALVMAALIGLGVWMDQLLVLFALYYLGSLVPGTAIVSRRLHDHGHSGWLQLIAFIPFGILVLIVLLALPGEVGPNRWGPDPRDSVVRPETATTPWSEPEDRSRV